MQLAAGAGAPLKRAVISPVGNCFSAGVRGSCGAIRCCGAGPAPLLPGLGPCRARAGGRGSAGTMPGGQPPCRDLRRALPPPSPCFGGRAGQQAQGFISGKCFLEAFPGMSLPAFPGTAGPWRLSALSWLGSSYKGCLVPSSGRTARAGGLGAAVLSQGSWGVPGERQQDPTVGDWLRC